jgi:cytochrome P450
MAPLDLHRDMDTVAICGGFAAFLLAHRLFKGLCAARPTGSRLYTVTRRDGDTSPLYHWAIGEIATVFRMPSGAAHTKFTEIARAKLHDPKAHVLFRAGPNYRVILSNVEDVKFVLIDNPERFVKPPLMRMLEPVLGTHGLVTIRDEAYHSKQFRNVSHAFNTANIREIASTTMRMHFTEMVSALRAQIAERSSGAKAESVPIVVHAQFTETTLAVISEAAFRSADFAALRPAIESAPTRPTVLMAVGPWLYPRLPIPRNLRIRGFRATMSAMVGQIIHRVRTQADAAATESDDLRKNKKLIDLLAENTNLSQEEILDHTMTFVFAGHETTANALNWTTYLVSRHPAVQEMLAEELASTFASGSTPSVATLQNLPYLHAVCNEALRYIPPVPAIARETTQEEILPCGTYLPAGITVLVPVHMLHRDKDVWGSDADVFRPERWIEDPDLKQKVTPCSFMPFAVGKRACIGKEFAMHELLIGIAMFFRHFEASWPADQQEPFRLTGIVTKPRDPFYLALRLRRA